MSQTLWARADAGGSLTISNWYIIEYQDDSPSFQFQFVPPPPRILSVRTSAGNLILTHCSIPWCTYHIEASLALAPVPWAPVPGSATNATAGGVTFTMPIPPGTAQRFYRAVSP